MRKTLSALALAAALAAPASAVVDINTDLKNLGPATAYDVAIVLEGRETIDGTYDGFPENTFRTFTRSFTGSNTVLHWEHPYDETKVPPTPTAIPPGTVIHVGYSTPDNTSKIIDMYWTDAKGNRILGGGIAVVGGHIDQAGVTFSNTLKGSIMISNVRYLLLSDAAALGDLTVRNADLMRRLRPLSGPDVIILQPGQALRFDFPEEVPAGGAALVVFDTAGADDTGSAATSTTFVQNDFKN